MKLSKLTPLHRISKSSKFDNPYIEELYVTKWGNLTNRRLFKAKHWVVTDLLNGLVRFDVIDTYFDEPGRFDFDVQVTYTDSIKCTFIKNKIIIIDDVNKN